MNNKERYINVEKAISVLRLRSQQLAGMYGDLGGAASGAALLLDKLANEETEIVAPVVMGEWIFGVSNNIAWMKCSNCLKSQEATGVFAYCPNCGADMRGENER